MNDICYKLFVLDGMRYYRLRWRLSDRPNYEDKQAIKAWKIGYLCASKGKSEKETLAHYQNYLDNHPEVM